MENITLGQLMTFGAFLMTGGGIIGFLLKPFKSYRTNSDKVNKEIEEIKEHQKVDDDRLRSLEADSKMTLRVLNAMLGHMQTGNNTGEMARIKNDLENYIIER